jgi:ribose 5-phosphate isomerase B
LFDHSGPGYLCGMRIAIGSDHAGFRLKEELVKHLREKGSEVEDEGTRSEESTDYPGYAHAVADAVTSGKADLGIVICGSGNGVNITANKHHGIRSALAWNVEVAQLGRQHNNANVLALPARYLSGAEAMAITDAFLAASFEGGRHQRRVAGIEHID